MQSDEDLDLPSTEADTADVVDQAESDGGEPVEEALASRERIPEGDAIEDELISEDAAEAEGGAAAD